MKVFLKNVVVFFALLLLLEFVLYLMNFFPGVIKERKYIKKVKKISLFEGYACDESGITHISKDAADYLEKYIKQGKISPAFIERMRLSTDRRNATPYIIGRDYVEIKTEVVKNEFSCFVHALSKKKVKTAVDSAYLNYCQRPINKDGFRSIEFQDYQTEKKKIFLLGDSFTWGHHTDNKTNSFADILSARGFVVYNSGITGTDLPQYYVIAKKYLRQVMPDVVIVNLFIGNDIANYDRKPKPFTPVFFTTNAGLIYSCPHGKYFENAESAYDFVLMEASIPRQDENFLNKMAAGTRITTILWRGLALCEITDSAPDDAVVNYWNETEAYKTGYRINRDYLEKISKLCYEVNARLIVSIIPEMNKTDITETEICEKLDGFAFSMNARLNKSDYFKKNEHFNEQGHEKHATHLINIMEMAD